MLRHLIEEDMPMAIKHARRHHHSLENAKYNYNEVPTTCLLKSLKFKRSTTPSAGKDVVELKLSHLLVGI